MAEKRMVFWSVKKLSKEFDLPRHIVARILRSLGAEKWSKGGSGTGTHWYWEE